MRPIISIGEALWDLLPDGAVLGGAPLNFAYRVQEQGHTCYLASAVGDDDLGHRARAEMERKGILTDYVATLSGTATGRVEITLDARRNPSYHIVPDVAYDRIPVPDSLLEIAGNASCIAYGSLVQRDARSRASVHLLLDASEKSGSAGERFFDVNLRPRCWDRETLLRSLERATVIKLNDEEAIEIASVLGIGMIGGAAATDMPEAGVPVESICDALFSRFPTHTIVVTMGAHGAFARRRDGTAARHPGFPVAVEDPCGSGDAFGAAFLIALLDGAPLEDALRAGNAAGATVATHRGATEPISPAAIHQVLNRKVEP